jgi:hypothetical protein
MNKLKLWAIAATSAALMLGASANAGADDMTLGDLAGRWVIGNADGVLVISGSNWFHPKHGAASIRRGRDQANFEVHYHQRGSARCKYRITTTAYGEILVLEPAEMQSPIYCPSGRLSRVSR